MDCTPTQIAGAFVIDVDRHIDARGFFARWWCRKEFQAKELSFEIVQVSLSHNEAPGTIRGLHFQWPPSKEGKLVRCSHGSIYDVIVDLRPDSPTFRQHVSVTLAAAQQNALLVPPGVAHGFQTLTPDTDVVYMMSDYFVPELQAGFRWNDRAFGIEWPVRDITILPRDAEYDDFDAPKFAAEFKQRRGDVFLGKEL